MKFMDYHSNKNNHSRRRNRNNYARHTQATAPGVTYNPPPRVTPKGGATAADQRNATREALNQNNTNVLEEDEADHDDARYGLRRAIKLWIKVNDVKELNKLVPIAPPDMVADEFRQALKEAMKRKTAESLRRVLKLYDTLSNPTEEKGVRKPAAAPYLPGKLGSLPERAERRLQELENWHKELLRKWQEKTENQYRRLEYQRDEKVIDVYRRHKIHIFMLSLVPILLTAVNLILLLVFGFLAPQFTLINLVLFIIAGLWIVWNVIDWGNDFLIITNRRVLHAEEILFFDDERLEIAIERVKQVSVEASRNIFEFAFRIGTVTITSAGQGKIIFNRLYMPDRIRKEIDDAKVGYFKGRSEFRAQRMENQLRNKFLGEQLKDWSAEPVQVDVVPHNELGLWQWLVPGKPVDEGGDQIVFRKHPIFLYFAEVKIFISYIVLLLLILFALPRLFSVGSPPVSVFAFVFCLIWFIVTTVGLWYIWEDWHNDRYILTVRNIVDVAKKPLGFDLESNVIQLADIQDVTVDKPSLLANIMDYGNVTVTTAGTGKPIVFTKVPEPRRVEAEISRRMTKAKNLAEDMNDKLTLDYFGFYQKIFNEMTGTMVDRITQALEGRTDRQPPPQ